MSFQLSKRSLARLEGVHPVLVRIVHIAIGLTKQDFTIVEGVRTLAQQREYYLKGKSKTMKSRHLTGHAVDLMPYGDFDGDGDMEGSWERNDFLPIADAMFQAAADQGAKLVWGGHWVSFQDCPHFELPPELYPWPAGGAAGN